MDASHLRGFGRPNPSQVVLGLKCCKHDTGAALIADGHIVAISEERLCGVKHAFGRYPVLSINYCLDAAALRMQDVDLVVLDLIGLQNEAEAVSQFLSRFPAYGGRFGVITVSHHLAHAASAFYSSGFSSSAVLVADGAGLSYCDSSGVEWSESESLYTGVLGEGLKRSHALSHPRKRGQYLHTSGIGKLYSFFSSFYCGFGRYCEGKLMGLAGYGDVPSGAEWDPDRWIRLTEGGAVCNARIEWPTSPGECHVAVDPLDSAPDLNLDIQFPSVCLPHPPRERDAMFVPIEYFSDVAAFAQDLVERAMLHFATVARRVTGSQSLCVAGGLGLNLASNAHYGNVGFRDVYIQPAATDTGVALGCALYGWYEVLCGASLGPLRTSSFGRSYPDQSIPLGVLDANGVRAEVAQDIFARVSEILMRGGIVGWFQGGSELGPRALGNRSILCDPGYPGIKDRLNSEVKGREMWRPFGAVALASKASQYFEGVVDSPYMLRAFPVRQRWMSSLGAVMHVDGTCRLQTVCEARSFLSGSRLFELLSRYEWLGGVPVLLNTSLNVSGQPIAESPGDALEVLLASSLDALVVGDVIYRRS